MRQRVAQGSDCKTGMVRSVKLGDDAMAWYMHIITCQRYYAVLFGYRWGRPDEQTTVIDEGLRKIEEFGSGHAVKRGPRLPISSFGLPLMGQAKTAWLDVLGLWGACFPPHRNQKLTLHCTPLPRFLMLLRQRAHCYFSGGFSSRE